MRILLFFAFLLAPCRAAVLSKSLSATEFDRLVEVIGNGSTAKLLRSAESLPLWPGLRLGCEVGIIPTEGLNAMGDGTGSLPGSVIIPRFQITKGFFEVLEVSFHFFAPTIAGTVSTTGISSKWTFLSEQQEDAWASLATFTSYTSVTAFNSTYDGDDFEVGLVASKDFVRLRPFAGAGLLFAHGSVDRRYSTIKNDGWSSTVHLFGGVEIETPVTFTLQLDFMDLSPMGSLFVGYSF